MGSCGNGEVWEVWKSLGMLRNTQGRLEDALECLNYHRRFSILGVVVCYSDGCIGFVHRPRVAQVEGCGSEGGESRFCAGFAGE